MVGQAAFDRALNARSDLRFQPAQFRLRTTHSGRSGWLRLAITPSRYTLRDASVASFARVPAQKYPRVDHATKPDRARPLEKDGRNDHFYDHLKAVCPTPSDSVEIHQITARTAGAPNYTHERPCPLDRGWMLEQRELCDLMYGYILVTIEKNQATIDFKGRQSNGEYQVEDSFSYTSSGP